MNKDSYRQPQDNDGIRWGLPGAPQLVMDLEECGCSMGLLLEEILMAHFPSGATSKDRTVLLGSILKVMKADKEYWEKWQELRAIDEERQLVELEEDSWAHAKSSQPGAAGLAKFLLERRGSSKFGRDAKPDSTKEEDLLKKKLEEIRKRGNTR